MIIISKALARLAKAFTVCLCDIISTLLSFTWTGLFELPHDKTNNVAVRPAKTKISLGIHPVWSESSLSAWRKPESLATLWVHSEDSDQTGQMPRLNWVFAWRTLTLLVLSHSHSLISAFVVCCVGSMIPVRAKNQGFKTLTSFCIWAGQFVSYLQISFWCGSIYISSRQTGSPVCQDLQDEVYHCYQKNPSEPLNCSQQVRAFTAAVEKARQVSLSGASRFIYRNDPKFLDR